MQPLGRNYVRTGLCINKQTNKYNSKVLFILPLIERKYNSNMSMKCRGQEGRCKGNDGPFGIVDSRSRAWQLGKCGWFSTETGSQEEVGAQVEY